MSSDTNGVDPLRHHTHYREDQGSTMERVAEGVASGLGTVAFVAVSTTIILIWIAINVMGVAKFDKYPFILLNLAFSAQAFYTGALVIISQKAQKRIEKLNAEAAAKHREELDGVNRVLLERNTELTEQIATLTEQIHEALKTRRPRIINY